MKLIKKQIAIYNKVIFIVPVFILSFFINSTHAQINMEIGGGIVQIHGYGPTFNKARYTIAFPDLLFNEKLGFYFSLESTGNPKYSKPIDNWGVTYRVHQNISLFYGHSLINMQTKHPEFFPFTGRQDLGVSLNPNKVPLNLKLGYAFYVGPTFQITWKILDKNGVDSDNDGVRNRFDKCSNTDTRYINWVNHDGCISDSDGDGVPDVIDSCRSIFGAALTNGCPDSDKDLIADQFDKCPNSAGLLEYNGCPTPSDSFFRKDTLISTPSNPIATFMPLNPKLNDMLSHATPQFVYDNYSLLPHFQKNLLPVITYLKKNPNAEIVLIGHTDAVGTEDYNIKLSLNRAIEVKKFFILKGIKADRISTFGNGTSSPMYNDNSETSKMANRRVELIIK